MPKRQLKKDEVEVKAEVEFKEVAPCGQFLIDGVKIIGLFAMAELNAVHSENTLALSFFSNAFISKIINKKNKNLKKFFSPKFPNPMTIDSRLELEFNDINFSLS